MSRELSQLPADSARVAQQHDKPALLVSWRPPRLSIGTSGTMGRTPRSLTAGLMAGTLLILHLWVDPIGGGPARDPATHLQAARSEASRLSQEDAQVAATETSSKKWLRPGFASRSAGRRDSTIEPFFLQESDTASFETSTKNPEFAPTTSSAEPSRVSAASSAPANSFADFGPVIGSTSKASLQLTNANNEFAFKLAKALIKSNPEENIFFSPLTLFSTLITMYSGASGQTAQELREALGLGALADQDIEEGFRDLIHSLQKDIGDKNSLKMLNALFADKQANISTKYTDKVRTYFNAYLEKVGFASEPEYVLDWVNKLVSWWTEGHIANLLTSPPDALTKLLLVNAIFFKGRWSETFDPRFTANETFTSASGIESQVPMMKLTSAHQAFCDNTTHQACALELLYSGGALSFLVLMPAEGVELSTLENSLTPQMMYYMISQLEERTLELALPKLSLMTSYELQKPLTSLGIDAAFVETKADFSRMGNSSGLFVNEVTHKNVLELSEEGTLAAGAAFATIINRRKPPRFYVDRPFLFLIRDLRTDAIVFFGRVVSLP